MIAEGRRARGGVGQRPVGAYFDHLAVGQPVLGADRLDAEKQFVGAYLLHSPFRQQPVQGLLARPHPPAQDDQLDAGLIQQGIRHTQRVGDDGQVALPGQQVGQFEDRRAASEEDRLPVLDQAQGRPGNALLLFAVGQRAQRERHFRSR